ncbi:MAG TPA: arylsulfatase [Planctomycetaceae bacterium]|nr:arylsulfatase [Planctomycetaceae bacterium]
MIRLSIVILLLAHTASIASADAPKPNIVYLLIDDLGYSDCGFMGCRDIQTPHIDALAAQGTTLTSFYVQPVCSPTRAALMTGRYATHTGVYTIVRPNAPWGLPLPERTLPQALREAGYTTSICGKWHLGEFQPAYTPTHRGFDRQYGHMFGAIDYFTHMRDEKNDWYRNDVPTPEEGYSTHLIAKEACQVISEKPDDKPLFLYVPFNGIHSPLQVPASYKERYARLPEPRRSIAGMLAAVDEAIGQIKDALDAKGISDNTLIVFSSDNGGFNPGKATSNAPLRAGKGTIYEGGVRVCAFATWPGKIPAGVTVDEPMHGVDWYPTLLKLAGATTDQPLAPDGMDIWPVLTQGAKTPHDAILLMGTQPGKAAVRVGDWKLLLNASQKDTEETDETDDAGAKMELYNLADDIGEKHDLAASQPEKTTMLRARLDQFLKDAVAPGNPRPVKAAKSARRGKKKARK